MASLLDHMNLMTRQSTPCSQSCREFLDKAFFQWDKFQSHSFGTESVFMHDNPQSHAANVIH